MEDLAKLLIVLAFCGLAVHAALVRESGRRSAVNWLLFYAVTVSMASGIFNKEAWPFSQWPMDNVAFPPEQVTVRVLGVDSTGQEHEIDVRAFQPLEWRDLYTWLRVYVETDPERVHALAPWLLDQANAARQDVAAGRRPGSDARWLGPLAAPRKTFNLPYWGHEVAAPAHPFTRLRIYEIRADLDRRPARAEDAQRRLLMETPP